MFVWFSELRTVDCGLRTALVGVNVVGEYCSVPGLIFASLSFPGLTCSFRGLRSWVFSFSRVFIF